MAVFGSVGSFEPTWHVVPDASRVDMQGRHACHRSMNAMTSAFVERLYTQLEAVAAWSPGGRPEGGWLDVVGLVFLCIFLFRRYLLMPIAVRAPLHLHRLPSVHFSRSA